jgi:hypothetical protein
VLQTKAGNQAKGLLQLGQACSALSSLRQNDVLARTLHARRSLIVRQVTCNGLSDKCNDCKALGKSWSCEAAADLRAEQVHMQPSPMKLLQSSKRSDRAVLLASNVQLL